MGVFSLWKALGKVALAVIVFFGLNFAVSIPVGVVAGIMAAVQQEGSVTSESIVQLIQSNPWLKTISFSLSAAAGVGAALILYYSLERDRSWALGWRQQGRLPKWGLGLLLGAVLIGVAFAITMAFGGIRIAGWNWTPELAALLAFDMLLFAAVGIGEEVFSRGYVYGVVKRRGGIAAAVVVSSVLFALIHSMNAAVFSNVFPMLNLTLAGVMLALFREWSGGLWVPIGVHMTWNFVQGDVLGMAVSGVETPSIVQVEVLDPLIAGGAFGLEGSFATTLVTAGASLWLWRAIRNNRRGDAR